MGVTNRLPSFLRSRLQGRETLQLILDNSIWVFCEQLLRLASGLIVGVWIARYLGPAQYGWLNYSLSIVGVVGSLASLGFGPVLVRELAQTPSDSDRWMGTAFFLRTVSAGLAFLSCVAIAWLHDVPSSEVRLLILLAAGGMFFQTFELIDLLFQAHGESRVSAWIRIGSCLIGNLVKVILILCEGSLLSFLTVGVGELAFNAAGWWWAAYIRGFHAGKWQYEKSRAILLLRDGWPIALGGLAIYVQGYADQVVIGTLLGGEELGQYSAAIRLVSVFGLVPVVVQIVVGPAIARAKHDNPTVYARRFHSLYRLMLGLFALVAFPLVVLGPTIVQSLFGASYSGAASLLPWLSLRLFFANFGVARGLFLNTEGLLRFALLTSVIGAVVNILLNLSLVAKFGAHGAIAASLVSFAVTTFGLEALHVKTRANLRVMACAVFLPWRRFVA